jgi:hypothetical protein
MPTRAWSSLPRRGELAARALPAVEAADAAFFAAAGELAPQATEALRRLAAGSSP